MRHLLAILLLTQISCNSVERVPSFFRYWFYDLPITETPNKVFNILTKDNRFLVKKTNDTLGISDSNRQTFLGSIIKPNLPGSLNKIDSSIIELANGTLQYLETNKNSARYSGAFKILRLEYFISDSLILDKLYKLAALQLNQYYLAKHSITSGWEKATDFGKGSEITYLNNKQHLQQLTILKKTYLDNTKSLSIEFHIDNN